MPRVSIVTISFNQARFLERAICSVLDQDYKNIEYIVVDAGSTDGSRDIIERYRSRITKVILEPDTGPANGLNKGFACSTGTILGYINADDAYLPGAVMKAAKTFHAKRDADVVYAHSYIVDGTGKVIRRSRSVPFNLRLYAYGAVVAMQQSTFFRRESFEAVGGFNEANKTSWDSELLVRFALDGYHLIMVDDYWSLYAIYPGSMTASMKRNERFYADHARMFRLITGKEYECANRASFVAARIEKWVRNPLMLAHRVIDKALGGSRLRIKTSLS
jgi:glycosyltransferase involved in cell wall biosynthesis